jgi:hypothetical protein
VNNVHPVLLQASLMSIGEQIIPNGVASIPYLDTASNSVQRGHFYDCFNQDQAGNIDQTWRWALLLAILDCNQALKNRQQSLPCHSSPAQKGAGGMLVSGIISCTFEITTKGNQINNWYQDSDFANYGVFSFIYQYGMGPAHWINWVDNQYYPEAPGNAIGIRWVLKPGVVATVAIQPVGTSSVGAIQPTALGQPVQFQSQVMTAPFGPVPLPPFFP